MNLFKNIKKGVASLTLTALTLFLGGPIAQAQLGFTDDSIIPTWAEEAIEELMDQGVISGNDDGSFAPNRQLNRAEVSKVIVLASGVDIDTAGGPHFPDVSESAWYYDYIETMYNMGWINGYPDGQFRPGVGINRAEIAKMVVNAFEIDQDLSGAPHFDDVSSSDWFYGYIETAYNSGLMRGYGDGTFGPANAVTRAETIKIVYDSQLVVAEPVGPAEGTLEVTLSGDTPRGTNVPFNATSVPYTTVEFTASDDSDVEVSSLTFTRLGLGDNDDFENVWVEIDGFKVGNDKSINNDDVVELRFNPAVVVPAGQTLVADIVASAKFTTSDKNIGHHNRIALVSAEDVSSTAANIVGDFPIEGEEMEVADYEVSQMTMTTLGSTTNIDVGDNFVEIGKFRMLNGSNTNKDVELRAITFKNDGVAEIEDVLENVGLYVSGEQVSAEAIMDGDYITFRLDNGVTGGYIVEDGDSRIFSIRADIVSAEKNDTIKFKIDNFEDVVGVEIGTSFGIKTIDQNGNNAEDGNATLAEYSIDSGDLNVSRDPASLGNQQYAPGSNDVVALTARIVVDQPLIVDGITLKVASGSTVADKPADTTTGGEEDNQIADFNAAFDNFRLFLNDNLIDSENDLVITTDRNGVLDGVTPGADGTVTDYRLEFNTTFEIAGTSVLKLVVNVQDGATTGDQLKVAFTAIDVDSPEYISTGDQVATAELLGSATGSLIEVKSSSVTITRTDGLSDGDRIVAGVDDVTFLKVVMDNNDSGSVNVTSLSIRAVGVDAAATYTNFTLAVYVDGLQQGSAKNLGDNTTYGSATFNDLSVVIPSAGQKEFTIVVDTIEDSADGDGTADTLKFNIVAAAADNVENGQSVTVLEAGQEIGTVASHTEVGDSNCNGTSSEGSITVNYLCGAEFTLVQSGKLTVSLDSTVYSDILVANEANVEVLKIRFNAADDEVQIKDLYLENDVTGNGTPDNTAAGDRVDFKLYDEDGQLLQEKQMTAGVLHFELANQDRIRVPKDESTFVTIKVDTRDITKANQTGKRLQVSLDSDNGTHHGIEAVTAATGDDIAGAVASTYEFTASTSTGTITAGSLLINGTAVSLIGATAGTISVLATSVAAKITTAAVSGVTATASAGVVSILANTIVETTNVTTTGGAVTSTLTHPSTTEDYWGDAAGQEFVVYRSQLEIRHAATQPAFQDPTTASQEVYRFTVTADAARQVELGRVSFDVSLSGMAADGDPVFLVKQVKTDGTIDNTATVTSSVVDTFVDNGQTGTVTVDFANQRFSASESRTYALFMSNTDGGGTTEADDDSVSVTIKQTDTTYATPANKFDRELTGATITVGGTNNMDTNRASSVNMTVGGETAIAIDCTIVANCDTNDELAGVIATAIDGNSLYSAAAVGSVVTISASAAATSSTIDTVTMLAAVNAAVGGTASTITMVAADTTTNIIWSDESDTSHSDTTLDWLNGYLVDVDTTSKINAD